MFQQFLITVGWFFVILGIFAAVFLYAGWRK